MSKVNRSTYQKVVEENKRLLADIKLLTEKHTSAEQILCIVKWRKKFREEKELNSLMKKTVKQYVKDHADELPDFLTKDVVN